MFDRPARRDPVLLGLAGTGLALTVFFLLAGGHPLVSWSVQAGLDVLGVTLAVRLARATAADRYARRFWRTVAVACASCTAGDVYQTLLVALRGGEQVSVVQTAFVVTGMAVVVIAMLVHPLGGEGRQRLRLWLDAGIVLAAVAVFLWYFSLHAALNSGDGAERLAAAATSVVMLLIAFALLKLLLSGTAPFTFAAGVMGSAGVAGTAVGASVTTLLTGTSDPAVLSLVSLLPCVLTIAALRLQELRLRRRGDAPVTAVRRRSSRLPYVAVIATQLLLVGALAAGSGTLRVTGVAAGALLLTGLVLGRQSAASRDNERLLTELEVLHEHVRHQATHDGLTGLPNRALLQDAVGALAPDDELTVMLIDLDGFKPVNDRHGHQAGDRVLVAVARRLEELTGGLGRPGRLGGDEFAVVLTAPVPGLAERISAALSEPISLGDIMITVGASVGEASGRAAEASRILHDADAAMYRVKAIRREQSFDHVA